MIKIYTSLLIFLFSINTLANIQVLKKRGHIFFATPKEGGHSKFLPLSMQTQLPTKTIIKTMEKSFVKLLVDKTTTIVIGPKTISKISKEEHHPTFLNLLKGRIRAQVDKNASPYKDHEYKLYLKTKTAALGVRGTELILVANEENFISSLVTLKGSVHVRQRPEREVKEGMRSNYELHKDNHSSSVMTLKRDFEHEVKEDISAGYLLSTHIGTDETAEKIKISPVQFKLLKSNENFIASKKSKTIFHKSNESFQKPENANLSPTPIGSKKEEFVANTHGLPGGKLDFDTALYISPPKGSTFDHTTQTYHFPKDFGGVDSETGDYIPPEGVHLHATQGFIAKVGAEIGKLKLIRDKLNRKIEHKLYRFSEITNIEVNADFKYEYDTNVHELLYDVPTSISNADSMKLKIDGSINHETFNNRRYLLRPRLFANYTHHNRTKDALVKRNNEGLFGGALEFKRKHKVLHLPAHLLIDLQYKATYKDYRNKNQLDHYAKDLRIIVSENFSVHRKYFSSLGLRFTDFHMKENEKSGNYLQTFFHQNVNLGRRYNLGYFFDYGKRKLKNSNEFALIYQNKFNFLAKKILRKTYLSAGFELSYWDFKNSLLKNQEKIGTLIKLSRRKGPFTEYYFSHEFNKFNSENKNQKFRQNILTLGASLHF
ncbi:hypothetical protein A9Q84_06155 [Halobacteriovorax marinus]|uniref:FecR protein domain-containing protein n=1 Tax=Halobacteriovorax marinus TaxID=97084 RepID=A0A1Y5F9G1_9BACT|nr:hypothetical protein A9Q84_06155 [Halobacteriovorax marinus]